MCQCWNVDHQYWILFLPLQFYLFFSRHNPDIPWSSSTQRLPLAHKHNIDPSILIFPWHTFAFGLLLIPWTPTHHRPVTQTKTEQVKCSNTICRLNRLQGSGGARVEGPPGSLAPHQSIYSPKPVAGAAKTFQLIHIFHAGNKRNNMCMFSRLNVLLFRNEEL